MNQGDKVLVFAEIDACRTGFKKKEYRVKINGIMVWIDEKDIVKLGMEEIKE